MDENKNTVNNDNTRVSNDMNYSFDFANQVANDDKQETSVENVVPEAQVLPNENSASEPVETPVVSMPTDNVSLESKEDTPMNVNGAEAVASETQVLTEENNGVSNEPVNTTVPQDNMGNSDNNTSVNNDSIPLVSNVPPVEPVVSEKKEEDEDSAELIKDKKATKKFLIILFVIVLAFIIALPFLNKIIG